MGSCKECCHYEVCRMHYQQKCELTYETEKEVRHAMHEAEKGSPICKHFADRSQFMKLPCKIGGTIYHIENEKIVEYIVFATHTYSRKSRNKHKLLLTLPSDGRIHLVINDFDMANGITVFLNKEEAKQALKKREDND